MTAPRKHKLKPRRRESITKLKSGKFFARLRLPAHAITGKRAGPGKACDTKIEAEQCWLRNLRGSIVGSRWGTVRCKRLVSPARFLRARAEDDQR